MTLLVVCSSLDLRAPLSATPAWWQLLKGLYEAGAHLLVTTYHGATPQAPWWQAFPNPLRIAGDTFAGVREVARRVRGDARGRSATGSRRRVPVEGLGDRLVRTMAHGLAAPVWTRHLSSILARHDDVEAVLLLSVPPNHVRGVASALHARFSRPVIFYDGDAPASLPVWNGFATGFRIYDGADLAEFDAVVSNSEGAATDLAALGARRVRTVHYAADPEIYRRLSVRQDIDVFFFGHTTEYREEWLDWMIGRPSVAMPAARFAVRGRRLDGLGSAERLPYLSFSKLREYVSRSRVNLAITRRTHADVFASSTMRPFELAMMGACTVANPCLGIERWFDPGREIVVVGSTDEALDRYRFLLSHESEREAIGRAARRRAVAEHTFVHRARDLLSIVRDC